MLGDGTEEMPQKVKAAISAVEDILTPTLLYETICQFRSKGG